MATIVFGYTLKNENTLVEFNGQSGGFKMYSDLDISRFFNIDWQSIQECDKI
jgi:hypothetical protein